MATPANGLSLEMIGARNAAGRFHSMADIEFAAIAAERVAEMSAHTENAFSRNAPQSKGERGPDRPERFADSFRAIVTRRETGFGFTVTTSQPQLALWIREGTAAHDIFPKKEGGVLRWVGDDGPIFARSVHHPGTKPNDWEDKTTKELEPLLHEAGNLIAARVVHGLEGRL